MKRTKTYRRPALEFNLRETDRLPHEGVHSLYHIQGGKGIIVHSHECPAADLAAAKRQLENMWQILAPLSAQELAAADREQLKK